MFDDINRYCWIQQQGSGPGQQPQQQAGGAVSNTVADTDGQVCIASWKGRKTKG